MDDKLAGYLALGRTVVVTGWNDVFPFSMGDIVTILTGALFATTVSEEIVDGFLGTDNDDKLAGTLAFGKDCSFVATIGTATICYVMDV